MRSVLTRCVRIEERTLSIGFGIKGASQGAERRPEFTALPQALGRRECVPLGPLRTYEIFRPDVHRDSLAVSRHEPHNGLRGGNNPREGQMAGRACSLPGRPYKSGDWRRRRTPKTKGGPCGPPLV